MNCKCIYPTTTEESFLRLLVYTSTVVKFMLQQTWNLGSCCAWIMVANFSKNLQQSALRIWEHQSEILYHQADLTPLELFRTYFIASTEYHKAVQIAFHPPIPVIRLMQGKFIASCEYQWPYLELIWLLGKWRASSLDITHAQAHSFPYLFQ